MRITRRTELPPEPLWEVMADLRSWPEWLDTMNELVPLDPERPEEVGAAYRVDQALLPAARWTITEWRPGRGFTWETTAFGVLSQVVRELEPVDRGTLVHIDLRWTGQLAGAAQWALGKITREYLEHEALKLESRALAVRD